MDGWKPSTGLGAIALALFVTAVVALTAPAHEMAYYATLFGMVASGTLALVHLGAWGLRGYLGVVDWMDARAALDRHAAPPHGREDAPGALEDDERGWYIPIEITLLAGQVSGFTDTGLSEIMGSDARPVMQRFLADRGVLTQRTGAAGYGWADGVTLADALRRLRMGDLLPFPAGPAPEVRAPVQPATRRDAPRRAAKGVIVEGVVIK